MGSFHAGHSKKKRQNGVNRVGARTGSKDRKTERHTYFFRSAPSDGYDKGTAEGE